MGDTGENWGQYLRRMTSRPGWSVAKLARESDVHRATIFDWIRKGNPRSVKLDSVRAIAAALGDDLEHALRAAGEIDFREPDPEIDLIRAARLPAATKKRLIEYWWAKRKREEQARLVELEMLIRAEERAER